MIYKESTVKAEKAKSFEEGYNQGYTAGYTANTDNMVRMQDIYEVLDSLENGENQILLTQIRVRLHKKTGAKNGL